MTYLARLVITLKPVVNDPQGLVVQSGLHNLGFTNVDNVRVGKYIEFTVDAPDEASARTSVIQMCERLLRNPVIEDYEIASLNPTEPLPDDVAEPLLMTDSR